MESILDKMMEQLGFDLVRDDTDALNYGVTEYEAREDGEIITVTINYRKDAEAE